MIHRVYLYHLLFLQPLKLLDLKILPHYSVDSLYLCCSLIQTLYSHLLNSFDKPFHTNQCFTIIVCSSTPITQPDPFHAGFPPLM